VKIKGVDEVGARVIRARGEHGPGGDTHEWHRFTYVDLMKSFKSVYTQ
jgi:hypothetical protein